MTADECRGLLFVAAFSTRLALGFVLPAMLGAQ